MDAPFPADTLSLHHSLLTMDTHIDIPWPTGPDPWEDGPRHVDLPKMHRGGITAGFFVAAVPPAFFSAVFFKTVSWYRVRWISRSPKA